MHATRRQKLGRDGPDWRLCAVALLLAVGLTGCIWDAFGECGYTDEQLATGEAVDGVTPDSLLAPMFTVHEAVLTWTETAETTTLTISISQTGPSRYVTEDCPQHQHHWFEISGHCHATSADGLVDAERDFFLRMDDAGTLESIPEFGLDLDYTDLYEAGVGHPTVSRGLPVNAVIELDPETFAPLDTTITADLTTGEYRLGVVTFPENQD